MEVSLICSVEGCGKEARTRGWCAGHYAMWRAHGDPLKRLRIHHPGKTVIERFLIYTTKTAGCWVWTGNKDHNGYGYMKVDGKQKIASRLSYVLHKGDIPEGMNVLHRCDNPICVNPEHLFTGTQKDNLADMDKKGRSNRPHGTKHGGTKATEATVKAIRKSRLPRKVLAQTYGLSLSQVYKICARTSRTHEA